MLSTCLPTLMDVTRGKVSQKNKFSGLVPSESTPSEDSRPSPQGAAARTKSPIRPTGIAVGTSPRVQDQRPIFASRLEELKRSLSTPRNLLLFSGSVLGHCAGAVNAIIYSQLGSYVSAVTNSVTAFGLAIEAADAGVLHGYSIAHAFLLVFTFWLGAVLCGMLVSRDEVHFNRSTYGIALICNSLLLVAAFIASPHTMSLYLAAAACGCQNGLCTMHFGTIVRTTHMTGITTDLGTACGRIITILSRHGCSQSKLSKQDQAALDSYLQKMKLFGILLFSFGCGTIYGSFLSRWIGLVAIFVPAGVTGLAGVFFIIFRAKVKRHLEDYERQRLEMSIATVQCILERTRQSLYEAQWSQQGDESFHLDLEASPAKPTELVMELDDQMDYAIQIMGDVEESMEELYRPKRRSEAH